MCKLLLTGRVLLKAYPNHTHIASDTNTQRGKCSVQSLSHSVDYDTDTRERHNAGICCCGSVRFCPSLLHVAKSPRKSLLLERVSTKAPSGHKNRLPLSTGGCQPLPRVETP